MTSNKKPVMANISSNERVVRIFAGVILSSVLIYYNTVWAVAGLIPFISGITGFCGIYKLMGINTARQSA